MEKIDSNLRKKILKKWKEITQKIDEEYGLQPEQKPEDFYFESEIHEMSKFQPGVIKENSLIINSEVPKYRELLPFTIIFVSPIGQ